MWRRIGLLGSVALGLGLGACSSLRSGSTASSPPLPMTPAVTAAGSPGESEESPPTTAAPVSAASESAASPASNFVDEIVDADVEGELPKDVHRRSRIPIAINARVKKWVEFFTHTDRERFARHLERGAKYKNYIQAELRSRGIPPDLYYLALIESGFVMSAESHASAVGVWQFIAATGKRYGLKSNYFIDERKDPIRSTRAAATYLTDLHNIFKSWYLAMAAYNAGEFRIMNAIMVGKSRDFWELAEKGVLPRETMDYVPKFLAAVIVGRNPERYGIQVSEAAPIPNLKPVRVPPRVPLKALAQVAELTPADVELWNPHFVRGMTPPGAPSFVWIPLEKAESVAQASGQLARHQADIPGERVVSRWSAAEEKAHRNTAAARAPTALVKPSSLQAKRLEPFSHPRKGLVRHTVRGGDTLIEVARQYNVTVGELRRWNAMGPRARLYVGSRVRVYAELPEKPLRFVRYRVRRGDTLTSIAERFGVSIESLKNLNGLNRGSIRSGQALRVARN